MIEPARIAFSAEGIPYSAAFDDIYHTTDGGLGQVLHVFMAGNGLPQRWQGREAFTILETGFGLGFSFLVTWQAWRNDPQRSKRLHFISVEKHPFNTLDLARLHTAWPEYEALSQELIAAWPNLCEGRHELLLDDGRVKLTLLFGDALQQLQGIEAREEYGGGRQVHGQKQGGIQAVDVKVGQHGDENIFFAVGRRVQHG